MHVPHEVPLGPRTFVNRVPELSRLAEVFPGGVADEIVIGLCSGLPGVGKTALARRYVEQVRENGGFPDGDLHVDFGVSAEGTSVSVADGLASCLTAVGVSRDVMPGSIAERSNLLRSVIAGKAVVIVLDDVTDAAQVLPFVPRTRRSAVLVTSTNQLIDLVMDGAERIDVAPLSDSDAALLASEHCVPRVEDEPDAFAELVRRCAGLPVALKVATAQLVLRPRLRIADLVAQIGDEGAGLAPFSGRGVEKVLAVFAVSYRALPEPVARVYRLMGMFPGRDLTGEIVAVLADAPPDAIADAIDTLIESGLVAEDAAGRLSLHSLVRRHAVHLAHEVDTAVERRAALRRVFDFLLVRTAFADRAALGRGRYRCADHDTLLSGYLDPFADQNAALLWLDRERTTLMAVLKAGFAEGWNDHVWQLAEAMTALYVHRRYLVDWTESSAVGADAAGLAGNTRAEARLRSFASRAWADLGDLARAARELDCALPMAEATRDTRLRASVWELFGRLYDETDPGRAPAAFQRAIDLFDQVNDERGAAFVSYFLGCSQLRLGSIREAVTTIAEALPRISAVGDQRMEGRALTSWGEALDRLPDLQGAQRAYDSAIEVLVRAGNPFYEAVAREKRADLALRMGDQATARTCLARAAGIHAELGSPRTEQLRRRLMDLGGS